MNMLRAKVDQWKEETGYGFGLYGTPAESLVYRFATKTKERFGVVEGITDKLYFTNSYHIHVQEEIDAFSKLAFESQFQKISSGGCISYIETPNLTKNIPAVLQVINYIYENIQYAEINTKSDYCQCCGFDGEIIITDDLKWQCPNCGNTDTNKMNVVRRTCGYVGENYWNLGRTQEIKERVLHL
jgi:ribonucleoside-triphosphate reductase